MNYFVSHWLIKLGLAKLAQNEEQRVDEEKMAAANK